MGWIMDVNFKDEIKQHSHDKEVYFDVEDILLDWADKTSTV